VEDSNLKSKQVIKDLIFKCKKTTLMIRNVPNKYTKKMMMNLLDRNFKDKYDFFYLRMDTVNKCNVGYAFINLISLNDIWKFKSEF